MDPLELDRRRRFAEYLIRNHMPVQFTGMVCSFVGEDGRISFVIDADLNPDHEVPDDWQ